jgi:Na+/melibiose symporter-like transporter
VKSVILHSREAFGLAVLFGVLYFVQGIAEPTEGLIAQPVRSLLDDWGLSPRWIGVFSWAISLPWSIKPLFGFLSDFVPLFGWRRKSYLLLASGAASACLLLLYWMPPARGEYGWLLAALIVPTIGVAMADVTVDALMVEKGQPLGITGQLQSVQWTAMYAATMLAGFVGGLLSEYKLQTWGFLICGLAMLPAIVLVMFFVREARVTVTAADRKAEFRVWRQAIGQRHLLVVASFIFLWNFNPFSTAVLQTYMTKELRLSESFYGTSVSILAIGAIIGSIAYGWYCRIVPMRWLVHIAIACGVVATVGYWFIVDATTTAVVSLVVGFTWVTGTLIQLDLAARTCPVQVAASMFALLMAVSNLGMAFSPAVGGFLYEAGAAYWGPVPSFHFLVGVGALSTAACWLLVPWLPQPDASSD